MEKGGVKATLEYVGSLLSSIGAPLLAPETLRQAKFDAPAAAGKLWPVLHSLVLLHLMGFSKSGFSKQMSNLWQNLELEGQHEEVAAFVRYYLCLWGCPDSALPAAEEYANAGSRDLLIALAWLMAHTDVFSRGLRAKLDRLRNTSPVDIPLPLPSYPLDTSSCPQTRSAAKQAYAQASAHVNKVKAATLAGASTPGARADALANQALTLYGRLRCELGALESLEACQAKKKHEFIHTQLEIRARTAEAAEAAGVKSPQAPPVYTPYELQLLRKRSRLEMHEKALRVDEAVHTTIEESAHHEALFWEWMESVLDERNTNGGQLHQPKPAPHEDESCRFPSEKALASLAAELDLRIEDKKSRDSLRGVEADVNREDDEERPSIAERIEGMESWLRERGWESYDELLEGVLERAEYSGSADVGSGAFLLPDDIGELLGSCALEGRGPRFLSERPSTRPVDVYVARPSKDGRKGAKEATGPTAPAEIDRLMKLALSSARKLARTRADNKRILKRMLVGMEEDPSVLVSGFT